MCTYRETPRTLGWALGTGRSLCTDVNLYQLRFVLFPAWRAASERVCVSILSCTRRRVWTEPAVRFEVAVRVCMVWKKWRIIALKKHVFPFGVWLAHCCGKITRKMDGRTKLLRTNYCITRCFQYCTSRPPGSLSAIIEGTASAIETEHKIVIYRYNYFFTRPMFMQ